MVIHKIEEIGDLHGQTMKASGSPNPSNAEVFKLIPHTAIITPEMSTKIVM